MLTVIAKIRICPGQLSYYDEMSGIYLTQRSPIAEVYAGTNCAVLRRSAAAGTIKVIEGSLGKSLTFNDIIKKKKPVIKKQEMEIPKAVKKKKIPVAVQKEEVKTEEPAPVETVIAEVAQQLSEEFISFEKKGETSTINTDAPNPIFTSSDTAVATVTKKGKITAKGAGEAIITVSAEGFKDAECLISVKEESEPEVITETVSMEV